MEEKHLSEGFIEVLDLSFAKVLDLKGFWRILFFIVHYKPIR